MADVLLLPIADVERPLLDGLRIGIERYFPARCRILSASLDPEFAFHPERQQYHSSELLARLHRSHHPAGNGSPEGRLLGVTPVDLYIPILTFVFGEAQVGDACCLVSTHRLRQEFYGLPPDSDVLAGRLLKESLHELGHTLELTHCDDYRCAMAPSHSVEWIDLKSYAFCAACRTRIIAATCACG